MSTYQNLFGAESTLTTSSGAIKYFRLNRLTELGLGSLDKLPFSIKVLLESALRNCDNYEVSENDVKGLVKWNAAAPNPVELPFKVARVILQDFTGVPCVVDLAAMRAAMKRAGGDPQKINPLVPVDLVIDHSVQVDNFGSAFALNNNIEIEFERNRERYEFLKWGQRAFKNFGVVPPATGIVHQVNLEYLAKVVWTKDGYAFPDSLVGTDSHTTMINGLGVVGWGVGGIEAEACMLGQPIFMVTPQVVGMKLHGRLPEGATATDLVLTITQILRKHGVVEKFVEFFGEGLSTMSVADRATIANMAPEYGATMGFFPVDELTLTYMRLTGRTNDQIDLVERYCKEQGLWRQKDVEPNFTQTLELDLGTVTPSLAGPKRPQDRVDLPVVSKGFREAFAKELAPKEGAAAPAGGTLKHGDVTIAAITSCTNTSNPSVMIAAGLVAKNAVEKGLKSKPYVKTSLSPGSRVVTDYFEAAGLQKYLDELGFQTTGYGCMTCIGNSGPLPDAVAAEVEAKDLVVAGVLSGNRNFEGRINQHVKANYLASPPLVVAYALAGSVDLDLTKDPLGVGKDGAPVYLKDIWPSQQQVAETIAAAVQPSQFMTEYENVGEKNPKWNEIPVKGGELFAWDEKSTYIQEPPFFTDLSPTPKPIAPITGARVLVMVADSVTTDHISPAGNIKKDSPAGRFLMDNGVTAADFNSYGARRGNDRVMTRGTFANIRLRNQLAPGTEGGLTTYLPTGAVESIYDASIKYQASGTPLIVLSGKDYGMGSSRDWAAKGTMLLGVKAVIAESFERIHRSNLVGMGVLPLQYQKGETRTSLGLTGHETFSIAVDNNVRPGDILTVTAKRESGETLEFKTVCRIDTPVEVDYYRNGGILQTVLLRILKNG
ncbi:aconitate hydratase AcnA [Humisphaera borealis]|uniref:Aconitate hydratase n=1 Tax=Humisphaera borealis TaxID=2807512 RepID=A0A7M2WXM9_9BACT|nr:aconitate hydratase AcnA [Humisphaera borealis]QOV89972.1 aconitate hydratase AcnA [Humisphaera borealis]